MKTARKHRYLLAAIAIFAKSPIGYGPPKDRAVTCEPPDTLQESLNPT